MFALFGASVCRERVLAVEGQGGTAGKLFSRALDPYRGAIRYALIVFAALTIALWILFGTKDGLGYLNKLNELLLIAALVAEGRLRRS